MSYPELFVKCVEVLLRPGIEGGGKLSHDPSDKGGLTRWGISQRSHPNEDIINLTKERAEEIYFKKYWSIMNLDGIRDDNIILHLFVFGVNRGPRTAIKTMQRLVGVDDDGIIGPQTLRAINDYNGDLLSDFAKREKLVYITIAQKDISQKPNLLGWLNRVANTHF